MSSVVTQIEQFRHSVYPTFIAVSLSISLSLLLSIYTQSHKRDEQLPQLTFQII